MLISLKCIQLFKHTGISRVQWHLYYHPCEMFPLDMLCNFDLNKLRQYKTYFIFLNRSVHLLVYHSLLFKKNDVSSMSIIGLIELFGSLRAIFNVLVLPTSALAIFVIYICHEIAQLE